MYGGEFLSHFSKLSCSAGKERKWNKCVLLFNFSDNAYFEHEDSPGKYICHINIHAQELQIYSNVPLAKKLYKSILDYFESPIVLSEKEKPSNIIAISVKKTVTGSKDLLPGMIKSAEEWVL